MRYLNILHIDDDEDEQEIFLTALNQITDTVQYTGLTSATNALEQLDTQKLTTDLIILDLNMPEMNGQQFLVEVKKRSQLKDIPVIILSTSSHTPTINLVKELGAQDFITKPDNFSELVRTLQHILR